MNLSLSDLRKIISEEADAVDAIVGGEPDAGVPAEPAGAEEAAGGMPELPEASPEAIALVRSFGLYTEPDDAGEPSLGGQLGGFLSLLESKSPGSIEMLSSPESLARLIGAIGDSVTVELLDITGVELEGMPTKKQHREAKG